MSRQVMFWMLVDGNGEVLRHSTNRVLVAGWRRVIGARVIPVFKKYAMTKHDTAIPAGRHRTDKAARRTRRDRVLEHGT